MQNTKNSKYNGNPTPKNYNSYLLLQRLKDFILVASVFFLIFF